MSEIHQLEQLLQIYFHRSEFVDMAIIDVIRAMEKKIINTKNAPAPIGPYNQAVVVYNTIYISGQICIDPSTGNLKNKDIQEETHQVMKNLKTILQEAGMGFNDVVKTTIFITDMNQFGDINEIYGKYFEGNFPARETVQVSALPKFANVEISMIGIKSE
jgi:2-iminobutanoate/2-iminopropanoate deaminase